MKGIVVLSVAVAMAVSGTAWAQDAKPMAKGDLPFKQFEGTWEGVARNADGLPYPVRTEIKDDGTARHATPNWLPSATVSRGKVTVQKDPKSGRDVMYYSLGGEQAQVLGVEVIDGRRVLRLSQPNGSILELHEQPSGNGKK